jgi:hypothetical protein
MKKEISKNEFIKLTESLTRHNVAKHFGISDMTAQRIADELGVNFKKFKPTGRSKIKLI